MTRLLAGLALQPTALDAPLREACPCTICQHCLRMSRTPFQGQVGVMDRKDFTKYVVRGALCKVPQALDTSVDRVQA